MTAPPSAVDGIAEALLAASAPARSELEEQVEQLKTRVGAVQQKPQQLVVKKRLDGSAVSTQMRQYKLAYNGSAVFKCFNHRTAQKPQSSSKQAVYEMALTPQCANALC